jgi:hypothetical protein
MFKAGDVCTSLLFLTKDSWFRQNLCETCLELNTEEPIAKWKIHISKKKSKKIILSESAIWQFIRRAIQDETIAERPLTFILCLMMARKRKLRMIKSNKIKGQEYQNYVNISRKIDIMVKVPLIGPADFSKLQKEIDEFFSGDE